MKKNRIQNTIAFAVVFLASCTNFRNEVVDTLRNPASEVVDVSTSSTTTHTISNIVIEEQTGQGNEVQGYLLKLAVTPVANDPLTNHCGPSATQKCLCELKWVQNATAGDQTRTYNRTKFLDVTTVQNSQVQCELDTGFWAEIAAGTAVTYRIIPDLLSGNTASLNTLGRVHVKGTSITSEGDFLDENLIGFYNIHRYSCYTKRKVKEQLKNAFFVDSETGTTVQVGSAICTGSAAIGSFQCPAINQVPSAQNYYRNLYVTSERKGHITTSNEAMECPLVEEGIKHRSYSATPNAERGKNWPLDSQFSLATVPTAKWNVCVSADSMLANGDPEEQNQICPGDQGNVPDESAGVTRKILGYAMKPNPNGSCSSFVDSAGMVRPTTRLRRYRVLYPPAFNLKGKNETSGTFSKLMMDEVYVADRLEIDSNTQSYTGNSIYGPKPCPFAWFDHAGAVDVSLTTNKYVSTIMVKDPDGAGVGVSPVNGTAYYGKPQYVATNEYGRGLLNGGSTLYKKVNPDGWRYPNIDRGGAMSDAEPLTCSATLPVVQRLAGTPISVKLTTTNVNRVTASAIAQLESGNTDTNLDEIMIRPMDPWTPQYVEDTTFQACAPVSNEHLDPPLKIYNDNGVYSWCAASYPTQNPNWKEVNSKLRATGSGFSDALVDWPGPSGDAGNTRHKTSFQAEAAAFNDLASFNSGCQATDVCSLTCIANNSSYCPPSELANCQAYLNDTQAANRCDRTIRYSNSGTAMKLMPLLAPHSAIKSALDKDANVGKRIFGCTYSFHNSNASLVGKASPSSGCCGYSGGSPILGNLSSGDLGHLEPQTVPGFSDITFCGNPVQ